MAQFKIKITKPTGKFAWTFPTQYDILLNKVEVGQIDDKTWKIRLKVVKDDLNEDDNPNCKWKWITLIKDSKSFQEAKDFLINNSEKIISKFNLVKE